MAFYTDIFYVASILTFKLNFMVAILIFPRSVHPIHENINPVNFLCQPFVFHLVTYWFQ